MKMVRTYQGYFQADGQFVSDNFKIPINKRAIINILDDTANPAEINRQQRIAALDKVLQDALEAEKNSPLTNADWDEFANTQSDFTREINL